MCGIAGILRTAGEQPVDRSVLVAMNQSMAHRGPDGDGIWVSPDQRVGIGHRRLSIIDLSDDAGQPMANQDGSVIVTFNGEIYNHVALRQELVAAGYQFATDHSDTEVLVHGFQEWGIAGLLPRLEGMFAFAIWEEKSKKLTIARDRVGIKPVYFTKRDGWFLFASEIKGLLCHPAVPRRVGKLALYHYLTYLTTPAPLTMFDGVYKLPASTYMEIDRTGRITSERYWDAVPGKSGIEGELSGLSATSREDFFIDGVRNRLNDAVEKRMMSDVPYGAFLSGGIDSSVNVALMDRFTDEPVNTFTVGFKDHEHLNELDYATKVAKLFKTNHHEVLVGEDDMVGYLDDLIHHQDEPLADWVCIPLHFVSKLAAEAGVKVIQVGEGSDEQFCGYNSYMMYLKLHQHCYGPFQKFLPKPLQRVAAKAAQGVARIQPSFGLYADAVERAAQDQEAFWSGAIAFWESQKKDILPVMGPELPHGAEEMIEAGLLPGDILVPDSFAVAHDTLSDFDRAHPGQDQLTRMIHNEFRLRLPELLLMRVDKITMAQSLEARVPFLDHALAEFTMDMPQSAKIKNGVAKYVLKKSVEGIIPDDVIYRKKMGFNAPMAEWLRGDFGSKAEAGIMNSPLLDQIGFDREQVAGLISDHRRGRRDTSLMVWVLYNLTAWHSHWIEV